jgi:hypothetical protein
MSDFSETWALVRGRFEKALEGMNQQQLNWRLHPDTLTLGEMAIHVAGAEVNFISQLLDTPLDDYHKRLVAASTAGIVNDDPFPFTPEEITPESVRKALDAGKAMCEPIITNTPSAVRETKIVSVLGPVIDGTGALARLAYHPGYHQGQAHMIKSAPGFPK